MVLTGLVIDGRYAGNAFAILFTVTDQDTVGSPAKNLTGLSARFAASRFAPSGDFLTTPVLAKDSAVTGQITFPDPTNGKLQVNVDEGDTSALAGDFYFELELYVPAGTSLVVATGTMTISKNVINP